MVPVQDRSVPTSRDHVRKVRVPCDVAHAAPVPLQFVHQLARLCVPHIDSPVLAATVHVLVRSGGGRGEVAADERLQHAVALERLQRQTRQDRHAKVLCSAEVSSKLAWSGNYQNRVRCCGATIDPAIK